MNFPITFGLFETATPIHYFFETLSYFVGIQVYYFNRKRIIDPIETIDRMKILLGCMVGALIGSRVIALLENPQLFDTISLLTIFQNKTIAGGFFGGLIGVELTKKKIGISIATGDIYVIPIIIGVFIGRIGCFCMGITEATYGIETTFFTGMNLGDGHLRHPVALYEMILMLLLLVFFQFIRNKELINGDRFKLFMVIYFLYRFFVEFIKPYHPLFLYLSSIQWTAFLVLLYYYRFILRILNIKKRAISIQTK
jgi:prolipoprotein diacylglyceryltransferase